MQKTNGLSKKLAWFAGLWLFGVATVTVIGLAIKLALGA